MLLQHVVASYIDGHPVSRNEKPTEVRRYYILKYFIYKLYICLWYDKQSQNSHHNIFILSENAKYARNCISITIWIMIYATLYYVFFCNKEMEEKKILRLEKALWNFYDTAKARHYHKTYTTEPMSIYFIAHLNVKNSGEVS